MLPDLKDTARVNCLIKLAGMYDEVFADKKSWDSSYAYALEAYDLSKRLGYKKGLAYALIQMASEQTLKIDETNYPVQKTSDAVKKLIDSCEYYCSQAIRIGEEIKNDDILGSAYWKLSDLVYSRNNYEIKDKKENQKAEEYLLKSISFYEKANNEISLGNVCRDLLFVYNDRKDKKKTDEYVAKALSHLLKAGDDRLLGDFYYFNLRQLHRDRKDLPAHDNDLKKAIYYYMKAEDIQKLGMAYNLLRTVYQRISTLHDVEEILKDAISHFKKTGNEEGEFSISTLLSWHYLSTGEFEKGFPVCEKTVKLTEKLSFGRSEKQSIWGVPYFYMSRFYKYAGDYETALTYLQKAKKWYSEDPSNLGNLSAELGDNYRIMGNYDSAMFYLKPFDTVSRSAATAYGITNLANLYIDLKEYNKAISLIKESMLAVEKTNKFQNGYNYIALAKAYLGKKKDQEALKAAREAQVLLEIEVHKIRMMENYEVLSQIFHNLKKNDSAYFYLQQYTALKDSLLTRQFYWRLNSYKKVTEEERKNSQINLLNKDNQLKEQKLKQQAYVRNNLVAGLIILFLLSVFIFRLLVFRRKNEKLKSENIQTELRQKATELEMQALRAQMNPHFIFNCLSSINRFIIKNETEAASDYLTRFSRLIRTVLINSQKLLITLEDELEMLKLYLDMERMRFKNSFDYHIHFKNTVDAGAIFIPSLLLQPFCENAIWHGLMHKEGQGVLDIGINMQDNVLNCTITDNGIGREKAATMKSKSAEKDKSMGLKITMERLALLNHENDTQTFYEIEDLFDEKRNATGTKVKLHIKYKESAEELV